MQQADDFGLMFYKARFYDPTLGRFVQADTVVPAGMQGYDRYAYANNSPMVFADPSGHRFTECGQDGSECGEKSGASGGGDKHEHDIASDLPQLIGYASVTAPPVPSTYDESTGNSSCAGCSVEPEGSGPYAGPGAVVDYYNGLVAASRALNDKNVAIYANVITYANGDVSIPSIYIRNGAMATSVSVAQVTFAVSGGKCGAAAPCITQGSYGYAVAPHMTAAGAHAGLGVIEPLTSRDVALLPSGYDNNPTNTFDRSFTVTVTLMNAETGDLFLPISNSFP